MKTIAASLVAAIAFTSCSGIDSLKYYDEIYNAQESLLKQYEKLDKTFNTQTGNPEGITVLQKEITTFSAHADSVLAKVKDMEKLDDDFFKKAFVSYAADLKRIVNTDYKKLSALTTVKEEEFTEAMEAQEQATVEAINKKLEALNTSFLKQQEAFAKKYQITLQ